jgi:hypothetical protein
MKLARDAIEARRLQRHVANIGLGLLDRAHEQRTAAQSGNRDTGKSTGEQTHARGKSKQRAAAKSSFLLGGRERQTTCVK